MTRDALIEELRERESQLRLAIDAAGIGTWRHNILTNEIHLDARSRAHYGFDSDTVTLDELLAHIHPDDVVRLGQEIAAITDPDGDGSYATEYRVIRSDGATRWLAVQARIHYESAGDRPQQVFIIGTSQDITARKCDEVILRRYADRLSALHLIDHAILEAQSPEQVGQLAVEYLRRLVPCDQALALIYDAATSELRVLAINSSAPSSLRAGSIIPVSPGDRQTAVWLRRPWHMHDASATSGLVRRTDLIDLLGVRSLIHIPLFSQGSFIGALTLSSAEMGVFSDEHVEITTEVVDQVALAIHNAQLLSQLQAERADLALRVEARTAELRMANAELARAARLKDEFLANMSHELRTPLNGIMGRAEILREQIYGPISGQQLDSLNAIEESGRHLLALINDILDLSKIEAGKIDLDLGPVSVAEVCQAAMRMVAQIALHKRIALAYPAGVDEQYIFADARRLKQILVNLLSNAVKFTPDGGRVGLEVCRDRALGLITFTVWDSGIGIDAEDQQRLFQPFSQIDSSLAREQGGSGLGLALVARLASLHGGSVAVESAPARGSRFSVILPWSDANTSVDSQGAHEALSAPVIATARARGDNPLILLAEDNQVNIELLQDYLSATGYAVAVAHDGVEAVARAQELHPALILMDIQMPRMDGLEATRQLRANPATVGIPVVALTALAMRGDSERCIAAGANTYLSKPIDLRQLSETIVSLLRKG
jgi:PAS domain S-box-containing protein